ncbi:DUF4386 family protein [Patulibacter sp. NPDC049589]|uniref:DUF4386 family protein n=1 Tax=Patulibacter sp. NPDC049589 TaxID=3154731 RepID=UPI003416F6F3
MSTTDDEAVLEAERRWGRVAGVAALLSIAATIATVAVASSASGNSALPQGPPGLSEEVIDRAKLLVDFRNNETELAISSGLRCVGLLLMIVIGVYLYRLTRTRDEEAVKPVVLYLTFVAPILIVISTVIGFVAFGNVADELVASGPRTIDRAKQLIDDSGGLSVARVGDKVTRVVAAIWLALLATSAMRVGLLTRFLGYWGVAGAACLVLLPIGDAMLAGWIGSMGILALGFWPGGRPLAWDSTEPQEIEAI